jgi:hypothetical protein
MSYKTGLNPKDNIFRRPEYAQSQVVSRRQKANFGRKNFVWIFFSFFHIKLVRPKFAFFLRETT